MCLAYVYARREFKAAESETTASVSFVVAVGQQKKTKIYVLRGGKNFYGLEIMT